MDSFLPHALEVLGCMVERRWVRGESQAPKGTLEQPLNCYGTQLALCGLVILHDSKKEAKLAQKLGQLQPYIAVLPQECMGQLASFGPS
jgi:hypothetical protein